MKILKVKVLKNKGSCRDTTKGKEYEAVLLQKGEYQPTTGINLQEPMYFFYDDIGDEVYTYKANKLVEEV